MENIRNSYKTYKNKADNVQNLQTYLDINHLYLSFLMEKILKGDEVTLPGRMGTIEVRGTKEKITVDENGQIKGLSPNWVKTKELWETNSAAKEQRKIVYNTNEHSDRVRYRFVWKKSGVLVSNKTLYSLRVARVNKRLLSNLIKQGKEYI